MYIIDCIILSRGAPRESLSYWSAKEAPKGSIIEAPLRGKLLSALVVDCRVATELKSEIRSANFALKKISKIKARRALTPAFLRASKEASSYFSGGVGSIISAFTSAITLSEAPTNLSISDIKGTTISPEISAMQAPEEDRLLEYRQMIREAFAKNESLFFCLPTIPEAEYFYENLRRGIEKYAYIFTGELKKKELITKWREALSDSHPLLIVGTSSFISIPLPTLKRIVIERAGSRFYKSGTRPFPDTKVFAEMLAKEMGAKLIYADSVLPIEVIFRISEGEVIEKNSLNSRLRSATRAKIIDMREEPKKIKGSFPIIAEATREALSKEIKSHGNAFVFSARKGLSPLTVCGDCGNTVLCNECGAPVVLYGGSQNFFLCHHCGTKRDARERCVVCQSWKLQTLGVGIELVEKELKKLLPEAKIFRFDKDSVKTSREARECIKKFYETPGSILLGTELALNFIHEMVGVSAIVSIDTLFAIPEFDMYERIFAILTEVRLKSKNGTIYQTRNIESDIFEHASRGEASEFYRKEIEARKSFNLPPFSTLIKISIGGKKEAVKKEIEKLSELFKDYGPYPFESRGLRKGLTVGNILLYVKRGSWPNEDLVSILSKMPPAYRIEISPERTLN